MNREHCDDGCGVEISLEELEANIDGERLALEEGVHEDEPDLLFRGGKEE